MLSIRAKKSAQHVKDYFKEHLDQGEYYSEQGKKEGIWYGKGLLSIGLREGSRVDTPTFHALAEGIHPQTGKNVTARKKTDRRSCYDLVFSAPKSISILALVAPDDRLIEAHHEALDRAFLEVENRAQARVRKKLSLNAHENRATGNLISSRFTHRSSRALDPQLHTHCVVFNVTHDPVENRLKALEASLIYESTALITALYRNELACRVRALGYEIEESPQGWRIFGVSKEIETLFSKRAQFIQDLKKEREAQTHLRLDNNGLALLAHTARAEKAKEFTDADLYQLQRQQLTPDQWKGLCDLKLKSLQRQPWVQARESIVQTLEVRAAKEAVAFAQKQVFERQSVMTRDEFLKHALIASAGRAPWTSIQEALRSSPLIAIGQMLMTPEEKEREQEILAMVQVGNHKVRAPLGDSHQLAPLADPRYAQQQRAAQEILDSTSSFLFLSGKAGSGKTTTLKQIIQHTPLSVRVVAPTSSAAETLRKEVASQSLTVQALLLHDSEDLKNGFLIVDEAGLLSTKQMHALLRRALDRNTRVLFVGDTRQHHSVESGDALRLLEKYSELPQFEISTITRQKEAQYLKAVQALAEGQVTQGLELFEKMGVVRSRGENGNPLGAEQRAQAVAQEYFSKTHEGLSTLIVTPTWAEHERVTRATREVLKKEELLPAMDTPLKVYSSLNFTAIEKQKGNRIEVGHFLSFQAHRGDFRQGELWEVVGRESERLVLKKQKGKPSEILSLHPKGFVFDVMREEEKPFAAGDLILMKANYRDSKHRIPNGSLQMIQKIEPDGAIHLASGLRLDPQFRQFVHGYAITSQGSQGKTRDHVILSADSSEARALSKNQLYVSASRGTLGITIFTDDFHRFCKAIKRSADRTLVTDLTRDRKSRLQILKEIFSEKIKALGFRIPEKFLATKKHSTRTHTCQKITMEFTHPLVIDEE